MNAKDVLNKISKMLNLSDDTPIQAKTSDGKILQSSNFDVNDDVMEVSADGKLTPVADGEYTITFTTPEGEDSTQVIDIDGGKIAAIETADEAADEKAGTDEEETEMGTKKPNEEVVDKKADVEEHMAAETKEAKALPNTTDEDPRNRIGPDTDDTKDPIISLSYRIDEMEKMVKSLMEKMQSAAPMEGAPEVSSLMPSGTNMSAVDDEEELPKLDGAPIDPLSVEQNKKNFGKKSADYQSTVLSKMYR